MSQLAPKLQEAALPEPFAGWFASRGWRPHAHQVELLAAAEAGHSALLVAPTGGGKTLAGFLPSLVDLVRSPRSDKRSLHTLYISPLKALTVDVHRNLETPVGEMRLGLEIETRTGDTPENRRVRQRLRPPDILLTTPEQIALLTAHRDAPILFGGLRYIIVDEVHALAGGKRGDLLALGLARIAGLAKQPCRIGLSATVADPEMLGRWLSPLAAPKIVRGAPGPKPAVRILASKEYIPWAGHTARYAYPEILQAVREARTALIFVNTRSQAELIFQELWRLNEDNLPIALHHGSLEVGQRRKVEAAMARGALRAVVCTSTLDLGIDWGAVDLVIQIGAPKGVSRLLQRIGRSNHRFDAPSRALLVPSNRFEVLECRAAIAAIAENDLDGDRPRPGARDVLAQHVLGVACSGGFDADALHAEVQATLPYSDLDRPEFDRIVDLVATGGYALRAYDRYRRIRQGADGKWRVVHPDVARLYRLNVGTIVEEPMLKVRLGNRVLGEVEEYFIEQLVPGDTFVFAGEVLRFEGLRDMAAFVTRAPASDAKVPAYAGGKFPLSTLLAARVRRLIAEANKRKASRDQVDEWLQIQAWRSVLPEPDQLLVETFPRGNRWYLVAYPFEGRLAHQTLGMLLTRRMERMRFRPTGFVASEYALAVWGLHRADRMEALFAEDMLGDDLEGWLAESALLKRTFRHCAIIAGLIERRHPGQEKSGRQVTFSSDLIYDVLRKHEPDHVLLRATWADAAHGLLDVRRVADMLVRVQGKIVHRQLDRISPLAVPVMLEIGKEPVWGEAQDAMLAEAADVLIEEATRLV
jgi:ATP-dependent Lhr-like helicase